MVAVIEAARAGSAAAVKERLELFGREVLVEAMARREQSENGGLYLRGLIADGKRKSLEPMVERLGADADYQSMQQFLTDSRWDPSLVVRAVAERVAPEIDVEAWVLGRHRLSKQGERSPGVSASIRARSARSATARSASPSMRSASAGRFRSASRSTCPRSGAKDEERRAKAKIPAEVSFKTKPELGGELIEQAAGWEIPKRPVLGDAALW